MGIYIPEMKKPESFEECVFANEFAECTLNEDLEKCAFARMGKGCPLIEVKQHGRLVDIDELIERDKKAFQATIDITKSIRTAEAIVETHSAIQAALNSAEIIIPEERGKE